MANQYWAPATTNPATATNWESARGAGDDTGPPADGDVIILTAGASYGLVGYDFTVGDTLQFQGFVVEEGFGQTLGSLGDPVIVDLHDAAAWYDATLACRVGQKFLQINNYNAIYITAAPASSAAGQYGLHITGTHDDTVGNARANVHINCRDASDNADASASIGLGALTNDVFDFNTLNVLAGDVTIGAACSDSEDGALQDVVASGSKTIVRNHAAGDSFDFDDYATFYWEAGAVDDLIVRPNAVAYWKGSAAIGTKADIYGNGKIDCERSLQARTCAVLHFYSGGGTFLDRQGLITHTAPFEVHNSLLSDVNISAGRHKKYTPAAI